MVSWRRGTSSGSTSRSGSRRPGTATRRCGSGQARRTASTSARTASTVRWQDWQEKSPHTECNTLAIQGGASGRTVGLGWLRFGMFHHPAWAVGSYSSGPPAGGTPQFRVNPTYCTTRCPTLYSCSRNEITVSNTGKLFCGLCICKYQEQSSNSTKRRKVANLAHFQWQTPPTISP